MHIGALGVIGRFAFSLFTQAASARAPAADLLRRLGELSMPHDKEEIENVLLEVLVLLDHEEKSKHGSAKNVVRENMQTIVDRTLRGIKESSILLRSLKLVAHCCAQDSMTKVKFVRCGGVRVLVQLLQNAHEESNVSLMEEIAATLKECTYFQGSAIVLPCDQPEEAEGAAALLKISSLCSMLRTIDSNARIGFLTPMVITFASVCALRKGSLTVCKGLDGKKGIEFFIPLLDHSHAPIVAAATQVIQSMIRFDMPSCQEAFIAGGIIGKFVDLVDVRREPMIAYPALEIVYACTSEKDILREFILRDGLDCLFTMWCNGNDPALRELAQHCILAIEANETWKGAVLKSREVYRSLIQRRAETDAKEQKQQMQAMQQQRMFQQMMMEQLGIGPEMMEGQE